MISSKKIQDFGLSDKESKVYMSLLELGQGTAQQLSIRSGVNRATVYVVLESLMKWGLVSTVEKEGKTLFMVEEPYAFLKYLEDEKAEMEERIAGARKLIPELQQVYNISRQRAHVRLVESKEALRVIRKEILRSQKRELLQLVNVSIPGQNDDADIEAYRAEALSKGFTVRRVLVYKNKSDLDHIQDSPRVQVRYIPYEQFQSDAEFVVFDTNKIALSTLAHGNIGVVIENSEIYTTMRAVFEMVWKFASTTP